MTQQLHFQNYIPTQGRRRFNDKHKKGCNEQCDNYLVPSLKHMLCKYFNKQVHFLCTENFNWRTNMPVSDGEIVLSKFSHCNKLLIKERNLIYLHSCYLLVLSRHMIGCSDHLTFHNILLKITK